MTSFRTFIYIYLFGGVTFIPLVIVSLWCLNKRLESNEEKEDKEDPLLVPDINPDFKAGALEEDKGVKVFKKGWITVTNQYYYHFTELANLQSNDDNKTNENILQRSQLKKKQKFYAVLKHGNLFLYRDDSPKSSILHAIALADSFVTIWPRDTTNEMLDASLFTKRTCVALFRNNTAYFSKKTNSLQFTVTSSQEETEPSTATSNQFFLYFDNNTDKEDWYFQLINASKNINIKANNNELPSLSNIQHSILNPNITADTAHLRTHDMLYLIQTLHSTEGQLTTKWFNALIGRLFLSLQRTDTLNKALLEKVHKKLNKINKPGFLDNLVVEEIDVGTSAPFITNPSLREISPEGLTKIALNLQYKGNLSVIISTKVNINLGSRFKPREVSVQLAIKVKEISGPLIVLIKPPPSNRIWYAFETEPIIDLEIEPVVSSSKLSYTMITNVIKGKFVEGIKESLVMPYMDDIVFYSTDDEVYRGGIWESHIVSTWNTDKHPSSPSAGISIGNNDKDNEDIQDKGVDVDFERRSSLGRKDSYVRKSMASMDSSDSQFKNRAVQNIKNVLKSKTQTGHEESKGSLKNSLDALHSDEEDDPIKPKQYIKSSIKKFGKWYSEKVSTNNLDSDESSSASSLVTKNEKITQPPKMISNRRRVPPKPPVTPYEHQGKVSDVPTNPSMLNGETTMTKPVPPPRTELQTPTTSPSMHATEMFASKEKDRKLSMSSKSTGGYESNRIPLSPESPSYAFAKASNNRDFSGDVFNENLEDSVDE